MELKFCRTCHQDIPIENFYKSKAGKVYSRCRLCSIEYERRTRYKRTKDIYGSTLVPSEPGVYADEVQQKHVQEFLELIGFKYNQEKKFWYKEGYRDVNGMFKNVKPFKRRRQGRRYIPQSTKLKVIYMHNRGISGLEISRRLGVSDTYVYKVIKDEKK